MYLYGQGTRRNSQAALECLRKATELGNIYAQGHLVEYYYTGKFYSKAAELAKRATADDDINMLAKLNDCHPTYLAKGAAMAAFYLARCLQLGRGTEKNKQAAEKYYSKEERDNMGVCCCSPAFFQNGFSYCHALQKEHSQSSQKTEPKTAAGRIWPRGISLGILKTSHWTKVMRTLHCWNYHHCCIFCLQPCPSKHLNAASIAPPTPAG
ncbi:LRP2-binding protein isoform X3 [Melospiza georgiana]|nr:LRP2-binding protein isoform X3 [Melospiza georgiana]